MTSTTSLLPLRLLPAPAHDPPYDDELPPSAVVVRGSLALAFPPADPVTMPLRLVPPAVAAPDPGAALPDARAWAARIAQVVMEVIAGARLPAQLAPYASMRVLEHLEVVTMMLQRRHRGDAPAIRPVVRSVHVCHPSGDIAEASAVIEAGARHRALALRLEVDGTRWQCTALRIG